MSRVKVGGSGTLSLAHLPGARRCDCCGARYRRVMAQGGRECVDADHVCSSCILFAVSFRRSCIPFAKASSISALCSNAVAVRSGGRRACVGLGAGRRGHGNLLGSNPVLFLPLRVPLLLFNLCPCSPLFNEFTRLRLRLLRLLLFLLFRILLILQLQRLCLALDLDLSCFS